MKKTFALIATLAILSSCSFNVKEFIQDVKDTFEDEKIEVIEEPEESNLEAEVIELQEQIEELQEQLTETEEVASFITVTSPEDGEIYADFDIDQIEFIGEVSANATKIVVTAYYEEMSFVDVDTSGEMGFEIEYIPMVDVYTLQNFEAGDTEFTYRASMEWDNLGHGDNEYLFTAYFEDGSELSDKITIVYELDGLGKPVIYLYPEETTEVFVNVQPNMGVVYSDPELAEGWNVIANPNGLLYDLSSKSYFPYLYWEGLSTALPEYDEGFCVAENELKMFFKDKLSILGLNKKEISDFFDYWDVKLESSPYYLISFVDQDAFELLAPLTIEPTPDTIIRVFFDYELLDEFVEIAPQELKPGIRKGFTVIEWGGPLF